MSTLLIVTGASRGLGKEITLEFCRQANGNDSQHLDAFLVARNASQLTATKEEMIQLLTPRNMSSKAVANTMNIQAIGLDLGDYRDDVDAMEQRIDTEILQKIKVCKQRTFYKEIIFINNAGSLGHIGPCTNTPSLRHMRENVDLNVTSACWLSSRIVKLVQEDTQQYAHHPTQPLAKVTIVNISSLVAIQAFPSLALYSAGKAARDLYHTALAKELRSNNNNNNNNELIRILNYAPGPLETDMTTELRLAPDLHEDLRPQYQKELVNARDSAVVLVELVRSGAFESGQHIDYFDLVN